VQSAREDRRDAPGFTRGIRRDRDRERVATDRAVVVRVSVDRQEGVREMTSATQRYRSDAMFRNLVDMLYAGIDHAQLSPSEIREAAMLAHILYEERHLRPILFDDARQIIEDTQVKR
jgi:hypothetical protein